MTLETFLNFIEKEKKRNPEVLQYKLEIEHDGHEFDSFVEARRINVKYINKIVQIKYTI